LIAVLFPGQGSLQPGALRAAALLPRADELFAQASEILGRDVMLDDDAVAIARTDVAQRNVFLASIASLGALDLAGIRIGAVAGHSIGAYAAAVAAGVLRFGDAVRLVDLRGRTMARLFPSGYAMGVVSGLTERGIAQIIADVGGDAAYISGVNARDQITVAGRAAAIDSVLADAGLKGARIARRLDVSVPSHTPYMLEVRDTLQAALGRLQLRKPLVPYASNCDGRACLDAASVADDLSESVARPVRWADATEMLSERGARTFVEALPGDTLTALAEAAFPNTVAISVARLGVPEAAAVALAATNPSNP
jgi:malonate decarboxylase epsilon subunit